MQNMTSSDGDCRLVISQRETVEVCSSSVEYDLYELSGGGWGHGFVIGVRGLEDAQLVFVGIDEGAAREIFAAVVAGGVTACTLSDVATDILQSRRGA